jgi:hypothetical protein
MSNHDIFPMSKLTVKVINYTALVETIRFAGISTSLNSRHCGVAELSNTAVLQVANTYAHCAAQSNLFFMIK